MKIFEVLIGIPKFWNFILVDPQISYEVEEKTVLNVILPVVAILNFSY